jgi:hypothetical protein
MDQSRRVRPRSRRLVICAYGLAAALSVLVLVANWIGWLPLPLDTT